MYHRNYRHIPCSVILLALLCSSPAGGQAKKTLAERLGYPADAKLLIIHADDIALAHSVDAASFDALERKAVSSGSIMVPCPWLTEAAAYARQHPEADLGLHLTLTSEWKSFRWGPVAPSDKVAGLLDPTGCFPAALPPLQRATGEEVERELRAQVQRALQLGIHPTHLDTHMGAVAVKPEFFAAYVKVAREFKLPFFAVRLPLFSREMLAMIRDDDVVLDAISMISGPVKPDQWKEAYARMLRNVKPGVTQLIVHLGHDDAELQAITEDHPDFGSAWRQRDYDVVTSPEFKQALQENQIRVIGWKELKKLVQ